MGFVYAFSAMHSAATPSRLRIAPRTVDLATLARTLAELDGAALSPVHLAEECRTGL
jgi:hypothetical protein